MRGVPKPSHTFTPRTTECVAQGVANRLFWRLLLLGGLAPTVRDECLALTEQKMPAPATAARPATAVRAAAAELRLRGGMCTGCAQRRTPACEW